MNYKFVFTCFAFFFITGLQAQQATLTIKVITPPKTPPQDTLLVIGDKPVWGNWIYPRSARMVKLNDSTWTQENHFAVNTPVSFKITRGSYYKEALYNNNGQIPAATSFNLVRDTTVVIRPSNWNDLYQRSITGIVRYHHHFSSPLLKNTRDVVVWLPPSYFTSPQKRYPVLYAHDGQNIFDHTGGGAGDEWHMDEVADSLIRSGSTEEFIIVGMANTKDRWVEYSGTPEGYNYVTFIATELKPFIDNHYRTKKDKANTAAIGSSMGGLISFYMVWWYPEVFSKAACLSSGFYFDDGHILNKADTSTARLNGSKIYLDCGGQDLDKDFLPDNEHMHQVLLRNKSIKLQYEYFPADKHNEFAWANRLYMPLTFLFGKSK
ncbi:alpha/beta hydrolase-fold protein [Chitinophaga sp. MM2321]|uniref:alpha/beta hydrolase-fold protein n=1 Tax=Chitinophaga sp. MM2321 TaxID=3137178 RepID=UPI0032D57E0D